MFIDGIGLAGYRSFGQELQRIGPFEKINLFVEQNNSGKSNILLFLVNHFHEILKSAKGQRGNLKFDPLDYPLGEDTGKMIIAFVLTVT